MSFLRRILGGPRPDATDEAATPADSVADEQARERELMLEEARRLDDDFLQRQMRYADRSWKPPAQGGARRADDDEEDDGET